MTATSTFTDLRAAVTTGNRRLTDALRSGDAAGMAACYTREGQVLPPGSDAVAGKESIGTFWKGVIDAGIAGVELQTLETELAGDTIIEVGRFRLQAADGQQVDHGKYLVTWKQENGDWKIHRDIFNSSAAPQS